MEDSLKLGHPPRRKDEMLVSGAVLPVNKPSTESAETASSRTTLSTQSGSGLSVTQASRLSHHLSPENFEL